VCIYQLLLFHSQIRMPGEFRKWTKNCNLSKGNVCRCRLSHGFIAPRPLYTGPLQRLRSGSNPRTRESEASVLTTRPPKNLRNSKYEHIYHYLSLVGQIFTFVSHSCITVILHFCMIYFPIIPTFLHHNNTKRLMFPIGVLLS
jgi:hypothetical protein